MYPSHRSHAVRTRGWTGLWGTSRGPESRYGPVVVSPGAACHGAGTPPGEPGVAHAWSRTSALHFVQGCLGGCWGRDGVAGCPDCCLRPYTCVRSQHRTRHCTTILAGIPHRSSAQRPPSSHYASLGDTCQGTCVHTLPDTAPWRPVHLYPTRIGHDPHPDPGPSPLQFPPCNPPPSNYLQPLLQPSPFLLPLLTPTAQLTLS